MIMLKTIPVTIVGIRCLFGHLFVIPFTRLIINIIKQGIKTNTITMAIITKIMKKSQPNRNIPINAIMFTCVFLKAYWIIELKK